MAIGTLEDVFNFLQIAESKGFFNTNTVQARRTACSKLLSVLDDDEQRTVNYVRENLEVIKRRFQHLNNDVRGQTVDEYARRVSLVIADYDKWSTDRAAWEREVASKCARSSNGGGEKRARAENPKDKEKVAAASDDDADVRVLRIPLKSGFEVVVKVPKNLTTLELKRVVWALLPYANDWDPSVSPQQVLPMLDSQDGTTYR